MRERSAMLIVHIRLGFDASVTLALKTRRVYEVLGWSAWSEKDNKYVTFSERRCCAYRATWATR